MRFEKSLLDDGVWEDAKDSGCRYLHFGYESGVERVLKLMDKATTTEVMTKHLKLTAEAGIWNHCMGFFGFPGETREEAWQSVEFLEQNKNYVHSLGFGTFDLGRHNPVAKHPERWGVTAYKNPEWDLALDYYFTVKNGMSIEEAERVFQEFERNHNPGWDLRLYHPRIYLPLHLPVRTAEAAGFAISGGENCRRHADAGREDVVMIMSSDLRPNRRPGCDSRTARRKTVQGHAAVSARVGADRALSGAAFFDRGASRSRPSRHPARHQHRDVRSLLHDGVPDLDQGPAVDAAQGAAGEREDGRADRSGSEPDGRAGAGGHRSMCSIWRRGPKMPSGSCGASGSTKPTSSNGR